MLSKLIRWHGKSVFEAWELWRVARGNTKTHCLPLLFFWSIWLTRNGIIFMVKEAIWAHVTAKIIVAFHELPNEDHALENHVVASEIIDFSIP